MQGCACRLHWLKCKDACRNCNNPCLKHNAKRPFLDLQAKEQGPRRDSAHT